jgi:hypothetical protein
MRIFVVAGDGKGLILLLLEQLWADELMQAL